MGDGKERGAFAAARGAEGLCTGGVAFSNLKPRRGGLVGDGEFVFKLEDAARCFRLIAGVGVFGIGDLSGTVWSFPDPLAVLLCLGGRGREWSVCVVVAGFVLNI
jgi:hypothetical protein